MEKSVVAIVARGYLIEGPGYSCRSSASPSPSHQQGSPTKVLPPFPCSRNVSYLMSQNHQFYILPETSKALKYFWLLASFCIILSKCSYFYLEVWMLKKTKHVSYYRFDPTSRLCVNTPMANTFWPSWKSITWRTVLIWGQLVDHQMGCCKRQREMEEKLNCELSKPTT